MKWLERLMEACGLSSFAIVEDDEIVRYGHKVRVRRGKHGRFKKAYKRPIKKEKDNAT